MKVLVDIDSLLYVSLYKVVSISQMKDFIRKGYTKDQLRELIVIEADSRLSNMCLGFLDEIANLGYEFESSDVEYFLTSNIFSARKVISSTYKANRKPNKWVNLLRQRIINNEQAKYDLAFEADDLIADRAKELNYECIICSIDKDLNQIQGWKFDLYKAKTGEIDQYGREIKKYRGLHYVSPEDAKKLIWLQMLMGDSADNIKGIHGIGKVKAEKIIKDRNHFIAVAKTYKNELGSKWRVEFVTNYRLLKIGV